MQKLFATLLLAGLLLGCGSTQKYLPIIDSSLIGAKGVTEAGKALSVADRNVVACYVTSSFLTAIGAAQSAVDGWAKGEATGVIPSVEVDINSCLVLQESPMEPVLEADAKALVDALSGSILPAVESITLLVMEGKDVSCEDKAIAKAVFSYVSAVKGPLIEELAAPDGRVYVPAVSLEPCP